MSATDTGRRARQWKRSPTAAPDPGDPGYEHLFGAGVHGSRPRSRPRNAGRRRPGSGRRNPLERNEACKPARCPRSRPPGADVMVTSAWPAGRRAMTSMPNARHGICRRTPEVRGVAQKDRVDTMIASARRAASADASAAPMCQFGLNAACVTNVRMPSHHQWALSPVAKSQHGARDLPAETAREVRADRASAVRRQRA